MSAKPLNCVDRAYRSKPEAVANATGGRMAERHVRSVHRESCRPQGIRSPLRQFSPVKRCRCGRRRCERTGSQHRLGRYGEAGAGPSGFEAVACMKRSELELGRPARLPAGVGAPNYRKGVSMGGQESDPLIVLRDGKAVHMGKRWAGRNIEQRTHVSELLVRSSRVTLPAQSCYCASFQRSLMRENRT